MEKLNDIYRLEKYPLAGETLEALNNFSKYIEVIMMGYSTGGYSAVVLSGNIAASGTTAYMFIRETRTGTDGKIVKVINNLPRLATRLTQLGEWNGCFVIMEEYRYKVAFLLESDGCPLLFDPVKRA